MKIYKCTYGNSSDNLEEHTQEEIDKLFKEYPNGKIEVFNSFGSSNNIIRLFNSFIFETEPEKNEINPLLIHQIIEELKNG